MENSPVGVVLEEGVATVTLKNPPANALSSDVMALLDRVILDLGEQPKVRSVVITGSGKMFAAGADIKEIDGLRSREAGEQLAARGQAVMNRIEGMKKIVIAAINGLFCLGGGLELAMACHIRIAGDRVRLGLPEVSLGIMPGFGGTQRLTHIVGPAKAIELILSGNRITAKEAREIGLVNQVVPDSEVLKRARALARKIASMGQVSVRAALSAVEGARNRSLELGLELESRLFGSLCETADKREGMSAFFEKRSPNFKDS